MFLVNQINVTMSIIPCKHMQNQCLFGDHQNIQEDDFSVTH
jgi:hypothetical protein